MTQDLKHEDEDTDFRALPAGTVLLDGQFKIDAYLSSGGFGITYLATDSLGRQVVIKECFPEALCRRTNKSVRTKTSRAINEFNALVEMFVREARSLAKLNHPNIVGVHQIFRANDTAYMVLDFVNGHDALQLLESGQAPLSPDRVVALAERLLDAIAAVHDADMLHRDISPDNILIDQDGIPCLIDFGAARQEATKKSRAISALMVVKDGYSPQEFYISGGQQGPASDLYSLGATLYHMITGEAPPNSQTRLAALAGRKPDPYQPLMARMAGYDPNFLHAIDLAMNVFPKDRPQSARHWVSIIAGQPAREPGDDRRVRRVVSALVNEVAQSIAKDAEAKALQAEKEVECEPEIEEEADPEENRWWPLTEPYEEPEPIHFGPPFDGKLTEDADTARQTVEDPIGAAQNFPKFRDFYAEAVAAQEARLAGETLDFYTPDDGPLEPPVSDEADTTDASIDVLEPCTKAPETKIGVKSQRTRRRISALVLIATLTLVFQDSLLSAQFDDTLTNVGSFFGVVMENEARI